MTVIHVNSGSGTPSYDFPCKRPGMQHLFLHENFATIEGLATTLSRLGEDNGQLLADGICLFKVDS